MLNRSASLAIQQELSKPCMVNLISKGTHLVFSISQTNPWHQEKYCKHYTYCFQNSKFDQEIPQSHTADQPTAPRGRAKEHQQPQDTRNTAKGNSPNPTKMIAKPVRTPSNAQTNQDQTQNPHKPMEGTQNNESPTIKNPPQNGQQTKPAYTNVTWYCHLKNGRTQSLYRNLFLTVSKAVPEVI